VLCKVRPKDRSWLGNFFPFGSGRPMVSKNILTRSGTNLRVTVVGGEVSPGEIPVALRAPSISPGPLTSFWPRRGHSYFALTTEQKKLDRREK
jgi:hypothetical protein